MIFNNVLVQFATLAGFAAFASMLISALKIFGVVSDTSAPKWVAGINFVGVIGLYAYTLFAPTTPLVPVIDSTLAEIAVVGMYVVAFVGQLGISKLTYLITRGMPVIGYSHTLALPKPVDSEIG